MHHLVLLLTHVPGQLPHQLDDGGQQAHLVSDVICVSLGRVLLGVTGGWQQDYSSSREHRTVAISWNTFEHNIHHDDL